MNEAHPHSEAELTIMIREFLTSRGIFHWKSWQGPMSQPRGVADIIGCYKGRFIAIEIKAGKRQLTQDQAAFLSQVERAGGCAFVARCVKDVVEGLRWVEEDIQKIAHLAMMIGVGKNIAEEIKKRGKGGA